MAYDEQLADRMTLHLTGLPGLVERRMFGGLAFMVEGNMACGVVGEHMIVRVPPEKWEHYASMPGAAEMDFTGRKMTGFVQIEAAALDDDEDLAEWVDRGVAFALTLPPK